jgi:glucose-6-phosphate isomerase
MSLLRIDTTLADRYCSDSELMAMQADAMRAYSDLNSRQGKGNDFLGWIDLPIEMNPEMCARITAEAARLRDKASTLIVIGIGGSYLGAKAILEATDSGLSQAIRRTLGMEIIFAGHHMGSAYHEALLEYLEAKSYALLVISKSGTTTEPAIAFRLLKRHLEIKYGQAEAALRIVAVTDSSRGALKKMADEKGYQTFVIPDDVGGRFSVLSPVGLLPLAAAGRDINALLSGARKMREALLSNPDPSSNPALRYAIRRNVLYNKGYSTEVMASFLPQTAFLGEWFKQLYGESEGKEGKGIFPAAVNFSTDLHSLGQYIQDGKRNLFETVLSVENHGANLIVEAELDDNDGLNYLAGKSLHEINLKAEEGTIMAHDRGAVPVMRLVINDLTEESLGALIYFFEYACAISGYILGVNPFDQPGVEDYKTNMFTLLGKPGYGDKK